MPTSEDDEVALKLSKQLKRAHKASKKQNIRHSGPLRRSQAKDSTTAATDRQWLQQCQQLYDSLPKNSQWARHKLKVRLSLTDSVLCWGVHLAAGHCVRIYSSRRYCSTQHAAGRCMCVSMCPVHQLPFRWQTWTLHACSSMLLRRCLSPICLFVAAGCVKGHPHPQQG
jgi:hypothetical protein